MGDNLFYYALERNNYLQLCLDVHSDGLTRLVQGSMDFPSNFEQQVKMTFYDSKTKEPIEDPPVDKKRIVDLTKSFLAFQHLHRNIQQQVPGFNLEFYALLQFPPSPMEHARSPTDYEMTLLEHFYRK